MKEKTEINYDNCTHVIDRKQKNVMYLVLVDEKVTDCNDQEYNGQLTKRIIGKTIEEVISFFKSRLKLKITVFTR